MTSKDFPCFTVLVQKYFSAILALFNHAQFESDALAVYLVSFGQRILQAPAGA